MNGRVLITAREAARRSGVQVGTLATWRSRGIDGPDSEYLLALKEDGRIWYDALDVERLRNRRENITGHAVSTSTGGAA